MTNRTLKGLRPVPQDQRHRMPPEAFEGRNIKVHIRMEVDLDVLNFFKAVAAESGTSYQSIMGAALRHTMETAQTKK